MSNGTTPGDHQVVARLLEHEPELGAGDESKCLPGWINSFADWFEKGEEVKLRPSMVSALLHTLVAARQRARRLVAERNKALQENADAQDRQ